jgi:hypothetical protein
MMQASPPILYGTLKEKKMVSMKVWANKMLPSLQYCTNLPGSQICLNNAVCNTF